MQELAGEYSVCGRHPPVNGAPVFERMCNKSITSKLGCMTSVNIWQLTINERQKKDQVFSSMLDEVRRGCPAQETVRTLTERVLSTPVVDKFQELMSSGQSPLCLFPTRQSRQDFNSEMLTKLDSELKEIKCVDEGGRRDKGYVQVKQEGHQSNGEAEQGLQHDGRTRGRS